MMDLCAEFIQHVYTCTMYSVDIAYVQVCIMCTSILHVYGTVCTYTLKVYYCSMYTIYTYIHAHNILLYDIEGFVINCFDHVSRHIRKMRLN